MNCQWKGCKKEADITVHDPGRKSRVCWEHYGKIMDEQRKILGGNGDEQD